MITELPLLGVSLTLDHLQVHRDWVIGEGRDIELQDFIFPAILDDSALAIGRAKALLDGFAARLSLHGPFLGFKIDCADPELAAVVRRRLLKCLDICSELGATQMVIHSPVSSWDDPNHAASPDLKRWQTERTRDLMTPVVSHATELGVMLVLENVEDIDPLARQALADVLNDGADTVQVSLDTGHALYAHVTTAAPPVDLYVSAANERLRHVHVQDADGYADRHWHPGEGTLNWQALFAALNRLPEMPRLIVEVKDLPGIRKGIDHLTRANLAR